MKVLRAYSEAAVSAVQLPLVEVAVRIRLYLDHVHAVLMERESLVGRDRRLLPLVEQRQKLADGLHAEVAIAPDGHCRPAGRHHA